MDFKKILEDVMAWINEGGIGPKIVVAILLYFAGGVVARLIRKIIHKAVMRGSRDTTLANFASGVAYQVLRLVVIIVVLGTLGVDTTSLAALIGGAGVAIGFALRDSLSNFAAGVMLILLRPFNVGDFVQVGGVSGSVSAITIVSTVLKTGDNKVVTVPNGVLFGGVITNYSRERNRRVDLVASIAYGDDVDKARRVLEEILEKHPLVLDDPAPKVAVAALADSSVNFNVRPWCRSGDYWTVHSEVTEQIKRRFEAADLNIPYPTQEVHVHQVA